MKTAGALRIAVSGKSGCGNSTVSRLVAEQMGLRLINFTFRNLAAERGVSLEEALNLAATDEWWDREVDRRQVALAREAEPGCVLGSRLAIWMLPDADLKVYLRAGAETRARRIQEREGGELERVAAFTAGRDRQDHERYLHLYGIDNNDYTAADLVIDSDVLMAEEVAQKIIEGLPKRG